MDPTRLPKIMINWKPEGRKNQVVPEEPGKRRYKQPCVKDVSEWADGTIEGNGIWKLENTARRLGYIYMCVCVYIYIMYIYINVYVYILYIYIIYINVYTYKMYIYIYTLYIYTYIFLFFCFLSNLVPHFAWRSRILSTSSTRMGRPSPHLSE
jgi:hypothetical protein